jgi:sortase (surface protein transpeptidase)
VLLVLALTAPIYLGAFTIAGRRVDARAGTAAWIQPSRLDVVPEDTLGTGAPTRVRVPSIKVDSPLEALVMDARGALQPPKAYGEAGWFAQGTLPGDAGPAVIAGHVDSKTGPAVFYHLRELKTGARIEVERAGAWLAFSVTAVERYPKTAFPSTKVYGPTPVAELRLITCGGTFDTARNSYRDNVVVYAVLTP